MQTRTKPLNKSKQREAILTYLRSRTDHPTAEQIYDAVKIDMPNISLGTVYRNLSLLTNIGEILKLSCGDSSEHFDGNATPHNHFVCNHCHRVIDIEMENVDFIDTLAGTLFSGKIEGHNILFYGTCEKCMD